MRQGNQSRSDVLEPGSSFATYQLEVLIGRGGMATVYRAREARLGRIVALKILMPDVAADSTFRERFIRRAMTPIRSSTRTSMRLRLISSGCALTFPPSRTRS